VRSDAQVVGVVLPLGPLHVNVVRLEPRHDALRVPIILSRQHVVLHGVAEVVVCLVDIRVRHVPLGMRALLIRREIFLARGRTKKGVKSPFWPEATPPPYRSYPLPGGKLFIPFTIFSRDLRKKGGIGCNE